MSYPYRSKQGSKSAVHPEVVTLLGLLSEAGFTNISVEEGSIVLRLYNTLQNRRPQLVDMLPDLLRGVQALVRVVAGVHTFFRVTQELLEVIRREIN